MELKNVLDGEKIVKLDFKCFYYVIADKEDIRVVFYS